MENQIIPITTVRFQSGSNQSANARDLHTFLQVGRDFPTWFKARVEEYGFVEEQDFIKFDSPKLGNQNGKGGDRRSIEYYVTLDMAKELAMVEKNDQGKKARRYFIEVEKQWKAMAALPAPMSCDPFVKVSVKIRRTDLMNLKIAASLADKSLNRYIYDTLMSSTDNKMMMPADEGRYGAPATTFPRKLIMHITGEGRLFGALIQPCY
jgi:phage anti-repressor protein